MQPQPLSTSGRYRTVALIGQGGMATVKLAALPGPLGVQKLLVVKEVLPHLAYDPEFVAMFLAEARLAARFHHPNLIQTYEVGDTGDHTFLVMEYLDGQTLSALRSRLDGKVPLPVVVCVLTRVLAGLHYAHELRDTGDRPLGVVHRDVSPQNVFLCYDGGIKLADFGVAKVEDAAVKTRAGVFKGKSAYASPEQLAGDPVDRRSDVFSVGVLLWEALTGGRVTKGLEERAAIDRRLRGDDPSVLSVAPDADPELAAICATAMASRPADRFETAEAMQLRLEEYTARATTRARDTDVGLLVAHTFEAERTRLRRVIQERLATSAGDTGSFTPPLQLREASSPSGSGSSPVRTPPRATVPSIETGVETRAAPEPARGPAARSRVGLALALGALVGGGAAVAALGRGGAPPVATTAVSATLPAAAPSSDTAREVAVSVTADPPWARLSLDGRDLEANPFRGKLPADGKPHTLTAAAPGFSTDERSVSLDRDVKVDVALRVLASPPTPAASGQRPSSAAAPRLRTAPRAPTNAAHSIDSDDPYGATR